MSTLVTPVVPSVTDLRPSRLLSWGAIFGGCFAALSIHILLTMLGLGVGVRLVDPMRNDNPMADFSVASGIVWTISALISMAVGGWIAGRSVSVGERRTGGLHGFIVWSLSTVAVFLFLSGGAGLLVGGAARAVGKGASGAIQAVSAVGGRASQGAPADQWTQNVVQGLTNEFKLPNQDHISAANKQEISWALARFAADPNPDHRTALVNALTAAGAPRDYADGTVRRWEETMGRLRAEASRMADEAAQNARQAAEKAARGISQGAIWTFVAFLLGAIAASVGGRMGAQAALEAPIREPGAVYPKHEDVGP